MAQSGKINGIGETVCCLIVIWRWLQTDDCGGTGFIDRGIAPEGETKIVRETKNVVEKEIELIEGCFWRSGNGVKNSSRGSIIAIDNHAIGVGTFKKGKIWMLE